jgi:uncharacterized protein YdhG (YjbR/CyaY superfamily)
MLSVAIVSKLRQYHSRMARKGWTKRTPKTIDDYLAALSADQRAALERLRKAIHAAAPGVEECIGYSLPAFRLNGMFVAGFGASAAHCAYYPMSGSIVSAYEDELSKYDASKGTIRFQPEKPLPLSLVRKLVRARIAENESRSQARRGRPRRT